MKNLFARDEREASLDAGGDRLAYIVVSYGLLLVVVYRSYMEQQASWELLGLVVLGGAVSTAYRLWHRAFTRQATIVLGLTSLVALAVAAILALRLV